MYYVLPLISIFALVGLDRFTKVLVESRMAIGETLPLIPGLVCLYSTRNSGAAFGLFADGRYFFIGIMAVAVAAMAYYYVRWPRIKAYRLPRLCMTLIAAGAVGNGIDRVISGVVVDFFEFEFVNFAIFNVADIYITCGAALLAICLLFGEAGRRHG